MHVLITGVTGFLGKSLLPVLKERNVEVSAGVREKPTNSDVADKYLELSLSPDIDWNDYLQDIDTIIHLADGLRVFEDMRNQPGKQSSDRLFETSLHLARAARLNDIRTFVYISSIKAAAGETASVPLNEMIAPNPTSLYGRKKLELESKLIGIFEGSQTRFIALRPPLVYGPGTSNNFARLLRLADSSWPLPLSGAKNRRSFIYVENLSDAIAVAARNQDGRSGVYFVSDGQSVTMAGLIRDIRTVLGRPARSIKVPASIFRLAQAVPIVGPDIRRLTGPLEVSDDKFRNEFKWTPPIERAEGLRRTVKWWKQGN